MGKDLRLPTEDEYYALRSMIPEDYIKWEKGKIGNINLENWFSPSPVDQFESNGFFDLIGNVWQHCSTPIYPLEKFRIHEIYEDFTTPTFDGRHYMIKGGSFASIGNETFQFSRYAFRRHFYQFAGFRYVESPNKANLDHLVDETDEKVEKFLQIQYIDKKSYIFEVEKMVKEE